MLGGVSAQSQDMKFFRIASGSAGGTYFPMAGLLAQVISNPPGARTCAKGGNCGMEGLVAIAQSAHGSVANVNSIKSDQIESGFAQSDVTYWAYTGTGPFKGKEPLKKLCVLTSLYPEHVHFISGVDRKINSVNDIKGRKIGMGLPASGALVGAQLVVDAYGLKEKKDFTPEYVHSKTGADKIRDGHLDGFITVSGYPNASIVEMASTQGAKLVPIDGKPRDALIKKAPFYAPDVIPGGTYKGNDKDIETVAVSALWVSRNNLPEDLHYGVLKGLFGNKKAAKVLSNGHAKGKSITLDTHGVGVPIPYCPGAVKFYKEAGVYKEPARP
ncbi:MAG: TAXI family TRAP transporter solute-binding subunit [Hyphomicrobiaceae bacterium]|nr:TAXI family TRAP transporter solute-binding subunit [Hyphomicrobiaceae bacterium]